MAVNGTTNGHDSLSAGEHQANDRDLAWFAAHPAERLRRRAYIPGEWPDGEAAHAPVRRVLVWLTPDGSGPPHLDREYYAVDGTRVTMNNPV